MNDHNALANQFCPMSTRPIISRPQQIVEQYTQLIDQHLDDLIKGRVEEMFEIEDFAARLFIDPTHLSNTIKEVTGTSPCGLYQPKIVETAKKLLANPDPSIRDIALLLSFDPSQFTKWFKRFTNQTPKQYRQQLPATQSPSPRPV